MKGVTLVYPALPLAATRVAMIARLCTRAMTVITSTINTTTIASMPTTRTAAVWGMRRSPLLSLLAPDGHHVHLHAFIAQ